MEGGHGLPVKLHALPGLNFDLVWQVLARILNGCVLATDPSHLAYPLVQPTLNCIQYILDPDALPLSFSNSSMSELIKETAEKQRDLLGTIVEPSLLGRDPSTLDPWTLAREELLQCSLDEHDVAAQVMTSCEETLLALNAVHAALRQYQLGTTGKMQGNGPSNQFNPSKEYTNVAILGVQEEMMLNQQKLMTLAGNIDFPGECAGVV